MQLANEELIQIRLHEQLPKNSESFGLIELTSRRERDTAGK